MLRKLLFTFGIMLAISGIAYSQGTLRGKVTDDKGNALPFVNIIILNGDRQAGGAQSDESGIYQIKPIDPGKYDVVASSMGFAKFTTKSVSIGAGMTVINIEMKETSKVLVDYVVEWDRGVIEEGKVTSGSTFDDKDIKNVAGRSAEGVATLTAGVQGNDGAMGSVRGSRTDGTVTYVDGVKQIGSSSIPKSAIQEIAMLTGGVPAKYGEATGGVLNITTKGPSSIYGGSVEILGSLDGYNNFLAGFSMNGPLLKTKETKEKASTSILGFFISGEFGYNKDSYPAQGGVTKMKDAVIQSIIENPLRPVGLTGINYYNAEFLKASDMEKIRVRENANSINATFSGKVDYKLFENSNLTVGGSYVYNKYRDWSMGNQMMNIDRNGETQNSTMRVYGKFWQRFLTGNKDSLSKSLVKNVYYQLQFDYSKVTQNSYDVTHKDNFFNYGYIGKFKTYKSPFYERKDITIDNIEYKDVMALTNYFDTLVTFERSEINPYLANYTSSYYDLYNGLENSNDYFRNYVYLQSGFALLNGESPNSVFGLYSAPGTVTAGYNKYQQTQIGFSANGSGDIGNHAIEFGFQYEQKSTSNYGLGATGLWTLMRQLANSHIKQLDLDNPMRMYVDDGFGNLTFADTIKYNLKYDQASQRYFDVNIRKNLGLAVNGTDWVDVDNLDPSTYSLDMFSADEL